MVNRRVKRVIQSSAVPLVLLLACSCGMDTEDQIDGVEQGVTSVLNVDFDTYSAGTLGSPWRLWPSFGESAMSIAASPGHGQVLLLHGGKTYGHYVTADLGLSSSSPEIEAEFDILPDSGAAFVWSLAGEGSSMGRRRIRLQRAPGSPKLVASAVPSGDTACGTLASGTWSTITLAVNTADESFDVLINGEPTDCVGIASELEAPFHHVQVMDASNPDWGGDVRFDNIRVSSP